MSDVFRDPAAGWSAALIIILPLVILGTGELEERLRQRDSSLQRPVEILRTWVLPLFAIWSLARVLFGSEVNAAIQIVGSGLVLSLGFVALAALAIVTGWIEEQSRSSRRPVPRLLLAMPRLLLILIIGWVLIAGVWQVDLSAALTALGVTSLVVSFALQDTLGGIASGFTLLADQPFKPGDWICADDVEGRVVDTNWRSSRIQNRNGDLVIVPNGNLARVTITNFDEPTRVHRVVFPVQVAYVNSPTNAKEMLLAAASATPGVLSDPAPSAVVTAVDDPLMTYEVQMWIDDYTIAPRVKSDFGSLVWYHSHRRNVPLPSPAQDLFLWDGERASADDVRSRGSVLEGLRRSPLLDQLDDDQLDDLANAAASSRFAAGETILSSNSDDIILIEDGTARMIVHLDSADQGVLDLTSGDLAAVLDPVTTRGYEQSVVAITDCDVISLRSEVAAGVISRSLGLNTALDQIQTSRTRRVHRVLQRLDAAAASLAANEPKNGVVTELVNDATDETEEQS